jgi:hypothetical protein
LTKFWRRQEGLRLKLIYISVLEYISPISQYSHPTWTLKTIQIILYRYVIALFRDNRSTLTNKMRVKNAAVLLLNLAIDKVTNPF